MVLVLDQTPPAAAAETPPSKPTLAGLGRAALRAALAEIGVPEKQLRMRVIQLWRWMYISGATSFDQMTDVSKELRDRLEATYSLARPEIVTEQVSVDGTRKWLLRLPKRGHEAKA